MPRSLIYITSPSYSGSTLLTILLAEHPLVATIGELKASAFGDIETYRCSCGELLRTCPYWSALSERISRAAPTFDLLAWKTHFTASSPLARRLLQTTLKGPAFEMLRELAISVYPPARRARERTLTLNKAVIDEVCEHSGRPVFLDGSKDPNRALFLQRSGLWDLYVIALVRDGRGFVNSEMRHNQSDVTTASSLWRNKIEEIEHLRRRLPDNRFMTVRYEDLCSAPEQTQNDIFRFANLTPIDLSLPITPVDRHLFGNEMRHKTVSALTNDVKWRDSLSAEALATFYTATNGLNQTLGYPADG